MNVLFVMADQLRADYLSCYGNPVLATPNIDALARRGVRFERAFVQSGVCGPSRMSFYTGRYPASHGASWNFIPMPVSELTLGDYFEEAGRSLHLTGKTHFEPDAAAVAMAGAGRAATRSRSSLLEGGFNVVCRHEGDLPSGKADYRNYLKARGYQSDDPWHDFANSGRHFDGAMASGWKMRHAHLAAHIREEDSETAYVSNEALRFIEQNRDTPWALHLSYIKPHWPYIAPAPYHDLYRGRADDLPLIKPNRGDGTEHPVVTAYRSHDECVSFANEDVARHVRPAYMGLIKQIDDHLGRVFELLDKTGQAERTMVIFTSDHGDFLGDYGMGEKELFYDVVQRVPLIVADPRRAADGTRGTVEHRFAEAVDVVPTVLEALCLPAQRHRVEGRSLLPLIHGRAVPDWRDAVFSELDYSTRRARRVLQRPVEAGCRGWMVREDVWKLVAWQGYRPQLFNLRDDPLELHDLGGDPAYAGECARLEKRLLDHALGLKSRVGATEARVEFMTDNLPPGIFIGQW